MLYLLHPSTCLYLTPPCPQSASPFPSRPLNKWPDHWPLPKRVYIFSPPWATFSCATRWVCKRPAHSSIQEEYFPFPYTCHAATVHLQLVPMCHVDPSINQAQAFSSSFSWLYRTLHVAISTSQGMGSGYVLMQFTHALCLSLAQSQRQHFCLMTDCCQPHLTL